MKHSIYKTCLDNFKSSAKGKRFLREYFGKKQVTHEDFFELCIDSAINFNKETVGSLVLMKEESEWSKIGFPTIFIDNLEVLHTLKVARFSFKSDSIQRPFDTFSISFPEGTYIEGQEVKNCLVSIRSKREWFDVFSGGEAHTTCVKDRKAESNDEDDQILKISYSIDGDNIMEQRLLLSDIEEIDFDEQELSHWDRLAKQMVKIVISLCIYNSATEGKKLVAGFPKSALKLPKGSSKLRYKG
ncbi:hypothetical protein ACSTK6_06135 [Vibrio parahaemolyticus]|nr:hypothetical protein [Vibrio parahaemolyticus]